ncbi:hypothetical protein QUF88_13225 [Bacillus sp. DX1.1]|nr:MULTISPECIES: hypothetical protein [unclassified Bacillus (in: firmicutes)]MDM5154751.1 hypothetical protein [Bacillus sp. DX1.1]WJE83633.1 hypothetical protein QRE67_10720 [Bacillus sp. DX3.1]
MDKVWEDAKQADGRVFNLNTGEELFWDKSRSRAGQWDMGHIPEVNIVNIIEGIWMKKLIMKYLLENIGIKKTIG